MQVNDFEALRKELISIDFIDINCNEINRPFDFLLDHTITYAHLSLSDNDGEQRQKEKFNLKIEARRKFETETHFVRYLVVGNTNTNETYTCISHYAGQNLKLDLKGRYNLRSEDVSQLKTLNEQLENICRASNKLYEYFRNDCTYLSGGGEWMDRGFNMERWAELLSLFGIVKSIKSRTVSTIRTSTIYNFGIRVHSTDKLLKDIEDLFKAKKYVLELIIKELDTENANSKDGKKHFEQVESISAKFDINDYFKIIPFEIEYAYKYSAPYYYDGQRWIEYNFNGIKTPFKNSSWEDFRTYWKEEYYNESLERITYENINPYFEAYHKGFMKAYSEYEAKIKESTSIFGNNETFSNCVFDGAMKMVHGVGYGGAFIDKKRVKVIQIKNWYECGLLAGENYKAWYLIVNNHREFISLFRTSEMMINFYKTALFHTEDIPFTAGTRERLAILLNEIATPPTPKAKGNDKKTKIKRPTFIVMLEVAETMNGIGEFLPKQFIDRADKLAKYKKAIFDKFGFDYAESTINNKIDKNLSNTQRLKVIKMLNEYGCRDLAERYRIQYKSIR